MKYAYCLHFSHVLDEVCLLYCISWSNIQISPRSIIGFSPIYNGIIPLAFKPKRCLRVGGVPRHLICASLATNVGCQHPTAKVCLWAPSLLYKILSVLVFFYRDIKKSNRMYEASTKAVVRTEKSEMYAALTNIGKGTNGKPFDWVPIRYSQKYTQFRAIDGVYRSKLETDQFFTRGPIVTTFWIQFGLHPL